MGKHADLSFSGQNLSKTVQMTWWLQTGLQGSADRWIYLHNIMDTYLGNIYKTERLTDISHNLAIKPLWTVIKKLLIWSEAISSCWTSKQWASLVKHIIAFTENAKTVKHIRIGDFILQIKHKQFDVISWRECSWNTNGKSPTNILHYLKIN